MDTQVIEEVIHDEQIEIDVRNAQRDLIILKYMACGSARYSTSLIKLKNRDRNSLCPVRCKSAVDAITVSSFTDNRSFSNYVHLPSLASSASGKESFSQRLSKQSSRLTKNWWQNWSMPPAS